MVRLLKLVGGGGRLLCDEGVECVGWAMESGLV